MANPAQKKGATVNLVGIDFETYYDADYSLTRGKLTTEEYINDPRFEIIGVSIGVQGQKPKWFSRGSLAEYAALLQPLNKCAVVAHNVRFDAGILGLRLGIHPRMLIDTLSMSRGFFGNTVRNDLGAVAERLRLGVKGDEVVNAKCKHLADFTPDELAAYGGYCVNDTALSMAIFAELLRRGFPVNELPKIDVVMRMFTDPVLQLNPAAVERELWLDAQRREELMRALPGTTVADFRSAAKFADVLRALGVEPPTKVSEKKSAKAGTVVKDYAFAKNDVDFIAMLEHENPLVAAAVEAKLGVQSSQRESRARRFMGIYQRNNHYLPVPLSPSAAHTHRLGGDDKVNLQNLQRTDRKNPDKGLLRRAIIAPEGKLLVVGDLSQIEARLLCGSAGQQDKLDAFAARRDVYSEQASVIFNQHVDRKANPEDFTKGFIGKAVVLGCGYGLGHFKFGSMIYVGMLGEKGVLFDDTYVEMLDVDVDDYQAWVESKDDLMAKAELLRPMALDWTAWMKHLACAKRIIDMFRVSNVQIKNYWAQCETAIAAMYHGERYEFGQGGLLYTEEGAIVLPNGMRLLYPQMEYDKDGYSCLRRKEGRVVRVRLYGGLVSENCTQALAGIKIGEAMVETDRAGYRVALQVHDEIVSVVNEDEAQIAKAVIDRAMKRSPAWLPSLPVDAELGLAKSYGDAK